MRGKGKYKPQRGRGHRFSSTRDPDAYIHSRPTQQDSEESESDASGSESGSDSSSFEVVESPNKTTETEKGTGAEKVTEKAKALKLETDSESGEEEVEPVKPAATKKAPRELSRREREAIEKERARQHFLKMKEKEDAERLAVIRKRREEEAAQHAAEQKAKEEARFARR